LVDDPDVATRLETLTSLGPEEVDALTEVLGPRDGFEGRVSGGVRRQLDGEVVDLIVDLWGLGWRTATSLLDPEDDQPDE